MSDGPRCPHCKTELPEAAVFCAACGRRIEGWKVAKDATPPLGESKLPESDAATRQMEVTPSLLRAAAVSVKKGGSKPKKRSRSRLPLVIAMLLVAAAGGVGGFFVVRAWKRKLTVEVLPPKAPPVLRVLAPPTLPPPFTPPSGMTPAPAPKVTTRKSKTGKKAHVIASAPVAVEEAKPAKAPKPVKGGSGALPHKAVATDSKALQMPTVQHETTGDSGAPPKVEADDKQEAEARIDADSVRFVVKQHLPQVRACYSRAFKDSSPGGAVEIGFAIDAQGHAKNVRTETNTTDSEGLARCLEARVKEWQFPRPVGGDYELIYPFVFAPGS